MQVPCENEMIRGKDAADQDRQNNRYLIRHVGRASSEVSEASHRCGHVGHAAREAPFVVIPSQYPNPAPADNLCLVGGKNRVLFFCKKDQEIGATVVVGIAAASLRHNASFAELTCSVKPHRNSILVIH